MNGSNGPRRARLKPHLDEARAKWGEVHIERMVAAGTPGPRRTRKSPAGSTIRSYPTISRCRSTTRGWPAQPSPTCSPAGQVRQQDPRRSVRRPRLRTRQGDPLSAQERIAAHQQFRPRRQPVRTEGCAGPDWARSGPRPETPRSSGSPSSRPSNTSGNARPQPNRSACAPPCSIKSLRRSAPSSASAATTDCPADRSRLTRLSLGTSRSTAWRC